MQALYDLLPVIAFFLAYKLADIYVATGVLIAATLAQVAVQWLRTRTVSRMLLISAALVLAFGGATLVIHDQLFIMWKPTVLYVLFALALFASQRVTPKPLVQRAFESQLSTDARTWRIANAATGVFFLGLAAVNYAFVHGFTHAPAGSAAQKSWESAWATWKLATVGVVFAFALVLVLWLSRRSTPAADAA